MGVSTVHFGNREDFSLKQPALMLPVCLSDGVWLARILPRIRGLSPRRSLSSLAAI